MRARDRSRSRVGGNRLALVRAILSAFSGSLYVPSPSSCFTDTAGTTPCAVDQQVARINDLIGANHAAQATAASRPKFRKGTVVGGVSDGVGPYWLDFDGVDDRLVLTSLPFQMADSGFMGGAVNCLSVTTNRPVIALSGATNTPAIRLMYYATTAQISALHRDDAANTAASVAVGGVGVTQVVSSRKSGEMAYARVNGVQSAGISTAALGATTLTTAELGGATGGLIYLRGAGYGWYTGKGAISDAQLLTIEKYLGSLAGLTI